MKIDSKLLGVLSALFVIAIVVSSVGAADNLVSDGIKSESFAIDVPSGSDFIEDATTSFNVGDLSMDMQVFENKGKNANDVSAVMYMKDSSSNQNFISDAINDLRKDGPIVEETDKYFVVETKGSNWDFLNFDIGNDLDSLFSFADGLFSSDSNVDVSTQDADVKVSSADGINIVDENGSTVSISDKGLKVNDANGDDVSISADGIKVTDNNGNGEASVDGDVTIDADMVSNIENSDYAVCIKSPKNDQVIVIAGNNLDLLKSMADTASFK